MNLKWDFHMNTLRHWGEYRASVWKEDNLFVGEVEECLDYGWTVIAEKESTSLLELLAWVEEEVKFKMAHPS